MSATAHHPARLVYFTALAPDDDPNPFMAAIWLKRQGRPFTFICRGSAEDCRPTAASSGVDADGGAGVGRLLWHVRAA